MFSLFGAGAEAATFPIFPLNNLDRHFSP